MEIRDDDLQRGRGGGSGRGEGIPMLLASQAGLTEAMQRRISSDVRGLQGDSFGHVFANERPEAI